MSGFRLNKSAAPLDVDVNTVYGTDVYCDDSDVLAMAVHSGKLNLLDIVVAGNDNSVDSDWNVVLQVLPLQDKYTGTWCNGVQSKHCNAHAGVSLSVLDAYQIISTSSFCDAESRTLRYSAHLPYPEYVLMTSFGQMAVRFDYRFFNKMQDTRERLSSHKLILDTLSDRCVMTSYCVMFSYVMEIGTNDKFTWSMNGVGGDATTRIRIDSSLGYDQNLEHDEVQWLAGGVRIKSHVYQIRCFRWEPRFNTSVSRLYNSQLDQQHIESMSSFQFPPLVMAAVNNQGVFSCTMAFRTFFLFSKILKACSKISGEVFLLCRANDMQIRSYSASQSVYASITLQTAFFESISYVHHDNGGGGGAGAQPYHFKMSIKSLLGAFRYPLSSQKAGEIFEKCTMTVGGDGGDAVQFVIDTKDSIRRAYSLAREASAMNEAIVDQSSLQFKLVVPNLHFSSALAQFSGEGGDLVMTIPRNVLELSFRTTDLSRERGVSSASSSIVTLPLDRRHFLQAPNGYANSATDYAVILLLKELRSIIALTSLFGTEVTLSCGPPGSPGVVDANSAVDASCSVILATGEVVTV